MRISTVCIALALVCNVASAQHRDYGSRYNDEHYSSRSPVLARNGMASTAHPIASAIAVDILKRGGSAVDAAIAANAMLAVVEPYSNGIGGDLFAIVWDPETGELVAYNGSGRTPAGFDLAALQEQLGDAGQLPTFGALSVSVPGAVDGWFALHERFGKLPLAELLAPAIEYAKQGVAITEVVATTWDEAMGEFPGDGLPAEHMHELKRVFLPKGQSPREGEIFRNPDLANSYELIAAQGRAGFYDGEIAQQIVAAVSAAGGHLEATDLAGHRGEWVQPVSVNYRGYDVFEIPPNSQGIAALQILNIMQQFPIAEYGRDNADYWHVMTEASKLAYEDRAKFYADPEFSDIPLTFLLSTSYAKSQAEKIDMDKAAAIVQPGAPPNHGDTTYLATADRDGMMVSFIQSNYWEFGSGIVPIGTGFALQNRGGAFSLDPEHANVYAAGKRPFHTIIPAFVMKDGKPIMAFGVMGGFLQPQAHAQIIANMIDFGMNVQEAGDAARFVHAGASQPTGGRMSDGGELRLEAGVDDAVVAELIKRGHTVTHGQQIYAGWVGGYQAIWRAPETGVYWGGTEMRFDGASAGY